MLFKSLKGRIANTGPSLRSESDINKASGYIYEVYDGHVENNAYYRFASANPNATNTNFNTNNISSELYRLQTYERLCPFLKNYKTTLIPLTKEVNGSRVHRDRVSFYGLTGSALWSSGINADAPGQGISACDILYGYFLIGIRVDGLSPYIIVDNTSRAASESNKNTVTISMTDSGSGLQDNDFEYYWSTSPTELKGSTWIPYRANDKDIKEIDNVQTGQTVLRTVKSNEINIPNDNTYYLWIKNGTDNVGNKGNTGSGYISSNTYYSVYGPYYSNVSGCKVTFDPNGGTLSNGANLNPSKNSLIFAVGSTDYVNLSLDKPIRNDGYIFDGWYTEDGTPVYDSNGYAVQYQRSNTFWKGGSAWSDAWMGGCYTDWHHMKWNYNGNDITLYAHWKQGQTPPTPEPTSFVVTFDPNGGTLPYGTNLNPNKNTLVLTLDYNFYSDLSDDRPVKTGWTFEGWYTADGTPVYDRNGYAIQYQRNTTYWKDGSAWNNVWMGGCYTDWHHMTWNYNSNEL